MARNAWAAEADIAKETGQIGPTQLFTNLVRSMCSLPKSCSICPAGRTCKLWNDELFGKLRERLGVPDDFLNEGWSFNDLHKGTGKGGTPMVFIGSKYLVKELSRNDHGTLFEVAESYIDHVCRDDTLLSMILLHFQDLLSGRQFMAMRNEVGDGPFSVLYDLKGCADDRMLEINGQHIEPVHKRFWRLHMWCGRCLWSKARHVYFDGKRSAAEAVLLMTEVQRSEVLRLIRRDTQWLMGRDLMDYSLLVAVKVGLRPVAARAAASVQNPRLWPRAAPTATLYGANSVDVMTSVGIIDFLQKWTIAKVVAQGLKACEANKATIPPAAYARRFCDHFEERIVCSKALPSSAPPPPPPPGLALGAAGAAGASADEGSSDDRRRRGVVRWLCRLAVEMLVGGVPGTARSECR